MAYRELFMIEVREILRRLLDAQGLRRIARETSVDRKTVTRYSLAAAAAGLARGTALTDEVVHDIARRVQARAPADPSDEWREVAAHRARIEAWLAQKRPLRLSRIHV
jgi:hypothetical protein